MKPWVENLLALQSIDMKIRNLNTKLATVPLEKKRLEAVKAAARKVADGAKDSLRVVEKEIKEQEGQIALIEEAIRKLLVQSSMVKKNNEYQAMMADIEGKKQKISTHETTVIELLDKNEAATETVKKAEQDFAREEKSFNLEMRDLEELEKEIRDAIAETQSLRKAHEAKVEMKSLEIYTKLLKDKRNFPMAPVEQGGVCGNCRLKVTPQTINDTKKGALVLCDNCSHMLYMPGPVEE